jgi:hypothetical protein
MADQPLEHRGWASRVIKPAVARIARPGNGAGREATQANRSRVRVSVRFDAEWLRENDHHGFG